MIWAFRHTFTELDATKFCIGFCVFFACTSALSSCAIYQARCCKVALFASTAHCLAPGKEAGLHPFSAACFWKWNGPSFSRDLDSNPYYWNRNIPFTCVLTYLLTYLLWIFVYVIWERTSWVSKICFELGKPPNLGGDISPIVEDQTLTWTMCKGKASFRWHQASLS